MARRSEVVVNCQYRGLNPVQFGTESCAPNHSFGPAVRTHWLLHYVVSGFGIFRREGKTYRLSPGDIFVIPPYLETYYEADGQRPWTYIWVGFTADFPLPDCFTSPVISCPEGGEIFDEMLRCGNFDSGRSAFLSGCLWRLTGILLEKGKPTVGYVDKALSFIHSEYAMGITVSEIAERLNLDRSYFSTLFTRRTGVSPSAYLRSVRMNKAAELMTKYGESPSTAALSVGYEDLFHFSKSFKQFFGLSPRAYVKQFHSPPEKNE